jgi:SAM-dependent methyltransferase
MTYRLLERAIETGLVSPFVQRLPPERDRNVRRRLRRISRPAHLGALRRSVPVSHNFGWDRSTPVDRYYIERFLGANRRDICGHVLEVRDTVYADRFATAVTDRSVLDIDPTNPHTTIAGDLAVRDTLPSSAFDGVILTQTLQLVYELRSAVAHLHRALKPGGALLATVPGVSPVIDDEELASYWRFTAASCLELFGGAFGHDAVRIREYGNPVTAIAFLAGMAYEELTPRELETYDRRYTVVIYVPAVKSEADDRDPAPAAANP